MFYWRVNKVGYMSQGGWSNHTSRDNFPRAYRKSNDDINFEVDAFMDIIEMSKHFGSHISHDKVSEENRLKLVVESLEKGKLYSFMFTFRGWE